MKREKAQGPPCSACFPGILTGNADAFSLARKTLTAEGVRMESIEAAMRIYRIPAADRADLADKVLIMAGHYLAARETARTIEKQKTAGSKR